MNMTTKPNAALLKQASPSEEETTDGYDCYICISSDSLLVLDKQLGLVEWIIQGQDNSAIYLSADSEDDFLDAISCKLVRATSSKHLICDNRVCSSSIERNYFFPYMEIAKMVIDVMISIEDTFDYRTGFCWYRNQRDSTKWNKSNQRCL